MPVSCPSDQEKEMAYRPIILYLVAVIPEGAAGVSGITLLTPMADGSPAHIAHGHDSRRFLFEKTLAWPSLQSIFTCDSLRETFLGYGKTK